jgi:LacI family transcriptional regulator
MTNRTPRAPTLHDVAAHVGVSPRTVSRVVNDQGGFSPATRARVLHAIDELHYRPNLMARGLITRRSNTIAFIVPVLSDPFFPEVADGIQRAASAADMTMLFAISNGDVTTQDDVLYRLEAHSPDGVIVFPCNQDAERLRPFLDRGLRMVVIDTPIDHPNATVILSDLQSGTHLAVDHLVTRGRKRLAMIASSLTPPALRRRENAFVDALPTGVQVIVESITPDLEGGR